MARTCYEGTTKEFTLNYRNEFYPVYPDLWEHGTYHLTEGRDSTTFVGHIYVGPPLSSDEFAKFDSKGSLIDE